MSLFTHIVLTAPTSAIAEVYQYQLNLLKYNHNFIYLNNKCNIDCISDPFSYRVGSGGGTLNALSHLRSKYQHLNHTSISNNDNKILIIHSGGDSQRAPLYSLCGKAWMSINAYINESSAKIIATPLMLLIEELTIFCRSIPNRSLIIASSDVMLHFSNQLSTSQSMNQVNLIISNDTVTIVALPESIHIAKNHGVLISSLTSTTVHDDANDCIDYDFLTEIKKELVIEYLQKPSISDMHTKNAILSSSYANQILRNNQVCFSEQLPSTKYITSNDHNNNNELTLVDSGVVIFTGKAYLNLLSLLDNPIVSDHCTYQGIKNIIDTTKDSKNVKPLRIELYSDILHAMQLQNQQDYSLQLYMKRLGIVEDQIEVDHSIQERNIYIEALSALWLTFNHTALELLFVPYGRFEHLGTTKEALNMFNMANINTLNHSNLALFAKKYQLQSTISSNFLNECSKEMFDGISINSSFDHNNPLTKDVPIVASNPQPISRFVAEHSVLQGNYHLPESGMVSHISGCIGTDLVVMDTIMIQQIILKSSSIYASFDISQNSVSTRGTGMFILLTIGMNDDIKNSFMKSTICSSTWNHFFLITGLQPSDLWENDHKDNDARTIWNAKLFPIFQIDEVDNIHVLMKRSREWIGCDRLSLTWLQDLIYLIIDTNQNISNTNKFFSSINGSYNNNNKQQRKGEYNNTYNSAIHIWKGAIKVSLADILVHGDALAMLKWREWLQSYHCWNINKCNRSITNITKIYTIISKINQINLNKHICLCLWLLSLCDSPTYIHDMKCIQSSRCLTDYLITICGLDHHHHHHHHHQQQQQHQVNQILLDFNILYELINTSNDFNLNSLCIDYLKNDIQYNDDFINVIIALFSCISNISIEFHSRVLFLSAWILKNKSIYLDTTLVQKMKYINQLFIEMFDLLQGSNNNNNNNHGVIDDLILLKCKQCGLQILENIKDFLLTSLNSTIDPTNTTNTTVSTSNLEVIDRNNLGCIDLSTILEAYAQKIIALHIQQSLYHHLVKNPKSYSTITSSSAALLLTTTTIVPQPPPPSALLLTKKIVQNDFYDNKVIVTHSPVRIDLAGGWSDTPPICYEQSGSVLNVAIAMDQKYPIRCACRLISKPMISLHSTTRKSYNATTTTTINNNATNTYNNTSYYTESIECMNYSDFDCVAKNMNNEAQPCLLLKAVIVALNIIDFSKLIMEEYSLSEQLFHYYQGGIEVHCVSDLPPGSGMGGSSILAATILQSISELLYLHIDIDKNILVYLVSQVEQLLTTGGGWQDQVGCIYPGFKIGRCPHKLPLTVSVDLIPTSIEFNLRLQQRMFLIYTGQQRLAKNTLINALRYNATTPIIIDNIKYTTGIISQLIKEAEDCYHMLFNMSKLHQIKSGDMEENYVSIDDYIDKLAMYISNYWKLKKDMAIGSEPEYIKEIFNSLETYCIGRSLCGAGGGGYAVVILHKSYELKDIHNVINKINKNRKKYHTCNTNYNNNINNINNSNNNSNNNNDDVEQLLSIHHIDIDLQGIHSYTYVNNDDISSLERYLI